MPMLRAALLVLLFVGGFGDGIRRGSCGQIESHGMQVLSGMGPVKAVLLLIGGLAAVYPARTPRGDTLGAVLFDRANQGR